MKLIRYIWPIWIGIAFQFSWNLLASIYLGNFHSKIGNWIYSRNCNYGFCDGAILVAAVWALVGLLFIGNAIKNLSGDKE